MIKCNKLNWQMDKENKFYSVWWLSYCLLCTLRWLLCKQIKMEFGKFVNTEMQNGENVAKFDCEKPVYLGYWWLVIWNDQVLQTRRFLFFKLLLAILDFLKNTRTNWSQIDKICIMEMECTDFGLFKLKKNDSATIAPE